MALMQRVRVVWTGSTGLPGVSTFYGDATSTAVVTAVAAFFEDIEDLFPSAITWQFPSTGDTINDVDGGLIGTWSMTPIASFGGTLAAQDHVAGVGARAVWETGQIVGRRRLAGSTFLTNIGAGYYDTDGTLDSVSMGVLTTAAATLAATGLLRVWHRNTPGNSDGVSHVVTGSSVPDRITALRSRRY